ncbi:hypothetical protein [Numidum massiliense]|uniref:hypothetical protein n=1 Tax=Numidum massiliense TaxID=1522315 RepID=UPI0006D57FD6|nr:hypothetical protein [Numidum massiliense]
MMNFQNVITIAFLIFFSVMTTSCQFQDLDLKNGEYGVVYTDALNNHSEFIVFGADGAMTSSSVINDASIFHIEKNNKGELILPIQFGDKLAVINDKGKITKVDSLDYPLYVKEKDGVLITLYNTELESGTLRITEGERVTDIELDGILGSANLDEKYVYAFADRTPPVMYVIERKRRKVVKEIYLDYYNTYDIQIVNDKILLTSVQDGTKAITVVDRRNWEVNYIKLPYECPEFIKQDDDYLYLTYASLDKVTILDKRTFKVIDTKEVAHPIHKAHIKDEYFYTITQLHSDELGGIICVYDTRSWDKKGEIELPARKERLVQDFILLK